MELTIKMLRRKQGMNNTRHKGRFVGIITKAIANIETNADSIILKIFAGFIQKVENGFVKNAATGTQKLVDTGKEINQGVQEIQIVTSFMQHLFKMIEKQELKVKLMRRN